MFSSDHTSTNNKRLKLKNILHLKVDNNSHQNNRISHHKKKRPMSATRFSLFKSNTITVYRISNNKRMMMILNDLLEIYEIKTMNDMNENKLSIGKYITLGKNDKILRPLFAKVDMKKDSSNTVKIHWHNSNNDVWELVFENDITCDSFCSVMLNTEAKDIALLDELISDDDEDDENHSDSETLAFSEKNIDLLQLFKDAISKMNNFKFENELPQRSISSPSTLYKRHSLIDSNYFASSPDYRLISENNERYKRFSSLEYANISRDDFEQMRISSLSSTTSVKKTVLE